MLPKNHVLLCLYIWQFLMDITVWHATLFYIEILLCLTLCPHPSTQKDRFRASKLDSGICCTWQQINWIIFCSFGCLLWLSLFAALFAKGQLSHILRNFDAWSIVLFVENRNCCPFCCSVTKTFHKQTENSEIVVCCKQY